jgi:hypothetical protein
MTEIRLKSRNFKISMFNIKISPKESDENFTELYADLIKRLHIENIAVNTRGDKWMEMRTQFSYENNKILYGKLIYYTILEGTEWYNKRDKTIQTVELDEALYPNAKEIEYFFIPEAHRFCFISKASGIAMSQIERFLAEALPRLVDENKIVLINQELTTDIIDRIINAQKLFRLEVGISYSNNDLSEEFEELLDNDLRESQIQSLNMTAKSFKADTIDLANSKILKAALKLSQSNGYAEATIQNDGGKNEIISTIEYPRKEPIFSTEGQEHIDVFNKIMNIFRNV